MPPNGLPKPLLTEGAFAASGTNIATFGKTHAWIGTGGADRARVLRTVDAGRTWSVTDAPLAAAASAGIFSIAFRDALHGVVVGGDYRRENVAINNVAVTEDGGITWKLMKGLTGYRSVVAYVPRTELAVSVGPSGADYSNNSGRSWKPLQKSPGFNTLSFAGEVGFTQHKKLNAGKTVAEQVVGWAAGAEGRIGKLTIR